MDSIDAKLLDLLQEDCLRSLVELGNAVGLSISGVKERLKRLRSRGDIRAYVALINPGTLGYTTCAFISVELSGKRHEQDFLRLVRQLPEVEECHHVSGEFPYLVKIWARDLPHLEELVRGRLQSHPAVARVQMAIVLSSVKDQVTGLAVPEGT